MKQIENLINFNLKPYEKPYETAIMEQIDVDESVKIAVLEYGTKHCGKRFPREKVFLANIDFNNIISFNDLFNFKYLLILWYKDYIITDIEVYPIENDLNQLRKDYDFIKNVMESSNPNKISEGDTRFLGAALSGGKSEVIKYNVFARNRSFVLRKKYLQKIINELGFVCRI